MTQTDNPLRKYFRQPAIYIRLPSGGKYYPPGTLTMPANNELAVLPMTAIDEITSRTPDALFNGSAIVEIIGSCVPGVRDAWAIPALDLNTLLVAVRMASYGHEMEIGTKCPACQHDHEVIIDLRTVMDSLTAPDYDTTVASGDLTFYFAPMNYRQINENGKVKFEDQKLMQLLSDSEVPEEEKMQQLGDAFRKVTALTVKSIAGSIAAVKTPDAMVTDPDQIQDFLYNCPKNLFDQIRNHVVKLREATDIQPVTIVCEECENQYQQPFTLDMSNFFVNAS